MDQPTPAGLKTGRRGIRNLSLKNRLIVSFTSVLFVICIGVSLYCYAYTRNVLKENTVRSARVNLGYLMDNVDRRLKQCQELSDWILVNRGIERVLIRDYSGGDPSASFSKDFPATYNLVNDQILRSPISSYVLAVVIYGDNNVTVRAGDEADGISMSTLVTSDWFRAGMNAGNRLVWPGIEKNISYQRGVYTEILPVARPILFADTLKQIGIHVITFRPELLRDVCARFGTAVDDTVLLFDRSDRTIYTNQPGLPTEPASAQLSAGRAESLATLPVPDSQDTGDTLPGGYFVTEMAGLRKLVCFHTSPYSGMTAYQIMDYNKYENRQVTAVTITVVILISVTVSALLTIFLSVRLTRPLEKIQHRMEHISRGDFARDPALEGADEIGQLGRGINDLATSVDDLLRHNISEEREKKALELKLLQNQINPHFIYNALNAIRMMAMIQKSHGIYDTVTALGNLLKETSKGAMEKIPLREEFFLLEQFIHIHNIRKKGLIQAIYALDEDIADGLIVRFLLQPLVENAILHGFEGKKGICRIWVTAKRAGDRIRITVRDDGVGIPPDRLASLFDEHPETEGERFNRVGVKNIQEQIRYVYGEAFVMTVESRLGEGTTVGIEIPVEFAAAQKTETTKGGAT